MGRSFRQCERGGVSKQNADLRRLIKELKLKVGKLQWRQAQIKANSFNFSYISKQTQASVAA